MEERKVAKLKIDEDGSVPAASASIAAPASSRLTDTTASFLGGLTDIDVTMSEGTRQPFPFGDLRSSLAGADKRNRHTTPGYPNNTKTSPHHRKSGQSPWRTRSLPFANCPERWSRQTPPPARPPTAPRLSRFTGSALALAVGLIHLVQAPEYLQGTTYIGVLFLLGGVALLAVAASLTLNRLTGAGWLLGLAVCLGMFVAGVLSRTTGLPAFKEEEWEPSLIASLVLEAGFVAVWWRQRRRLPRH